MTPNYDTKEGIASFLTDLEGIHRLKTLRREAGYERGERMGEWVVLGRWRLSTNGNFDPLVGKYDSEIPANLGTCPPVMTLDETYLFLRGKSLTSTSSWAVPPVYATCKTCKKPWTLDDCYDFRTSQDSDEGGTSLEEFVGQPLEGVKNIPALVNKEVHFVGHDGVYNANLPAPVPEEEGKYSRDGTRLSLNKKKWHYVAKDYVIQTGDHAMLQFVHFEHNGCYQSRVTQIDRDAILEAFTKAGYPKVNLITRKNEYCSCDQCTPWFSAQVNNETPLKLGWRKSVINLDWSETGKRLNIFDGEPVTVGSHYIHAHGYEKLSEYLGKLLPALGVPRVA